MSASVKKILIAFIALCVCAAALMVLYANPVLETSGQTSASSAKPLEVKIHETTWDSTDADDNGIADVADIYLVNSHISMSPVVENTSDIAGWAYIVVDAPVSKNGEAAYNFELKSGWTEIDSVTSADRVQRVFAYDETLAAHDSTTILFDDLVYVDDIAEGTKPAVTLKACATQAAHVDNPYQGWNLYLAIAGAL